ncbi:hypothetical protein [Nannocystis punicea]|uniref:Uncharacterized protein n=1 Tax=Nannocystis punicea TaxID=2995304 RepID=A0ABY7GV91_9BACT|nr:hypothetical protein [Nannocystis poenicansa]WAS90885.1 hypothetical protein O0S08_32250 [Nannocystis poenicansa]
MRPDIGRRLCVPAILAVSSVTATPACSNTDKTTMTETTGPSTEGPTTSTTTTTDTTTMGPEPTGTTTDATAATATTTTTEADTDGVPDCEEIEDQPTCVATPLCAWPPEIQQCTVDCAKITDEAVCGVQQLCAWIDGQCQMLII